MKITIVLFIGVFFGLFTKKKGKNPNAVCIGLLQGVSPTGFMSLMFTFALQIHAKPSDALAGSQLEALFFISFAAAVLISLSYLSGSPRAPCLVPRERAKLRQWQPVRQLQHSVVWHRHTIMFP